ncbi:MAG: hypothetical protein OEY52_15840, partial [Gammaproteobacteria bacterium]|nr:hypothetical protein [Gammaproteobacteria bacterium]
ISSIAESCTVIPSFIQTFVVDTTDAANGSVSPDIKLKSGQSTDIIITPADGYAINDIAGTCTGDITGTDFTSKTLSISSIAENCTVIPSFIQTFMVTTTPAANGSITPDVEVKSGLATDIVITPADGYAIDDIGGTCTGTITGNDFTSKTLSISSVTANCTVIPSFIQTFVVDTTGDPNGSISPTIELKSGGSTDIIITPADGYAIDNIGGTCSGTITGEDFVSKTLSISSIAADCTVTASFIQTFTISTTTTTADGAISPGAVVKSGANHSISVTPGTDFAIDTVEGCGVTFSTGNDFDSANYTTGSIDADCTVTASFIATHQITASAGTGGNITPTTKEVKDNTTADFIVTPLAGFAIDVNGVTGCGASLLSGDGFGTSTYRTNNITADCAISASFVNAYTVYTSVIGNGGISPTTTDVRENSTPEFVVTPASGHAIVGVSGCGVTRTAGDGFGVSTYTASAVNANCTVEATFINAHTVSTNVVGNGGISPTSIDVRDNQTTEFTVSPTTGHAIDSVSGCGVTLDTGDGFGESTYITDPINANCSVTATFVSSYTVSTSVIGSGNISPTTIEVRAGEAPSFTVTPLNADYAIDTVTGCGAAIDTGDGFSESTYIINPVNADCTVEATFVNAYTVSSSVTGNGTVSFISLNVRAGTTHSFTATPALSNAIDTVSGCGITQTAGDDFNGADYITGPINADCTINANFIATYTADTILGPDGSVSPASQTVKAGSPVIFDITPIAGYEVANTTGCTGSLTGNTYEIASLDADCTLTIDFTAILYTDPFAKAVTLDWVDGGASGYNIYYSNQKDFDPDSHAGNPNVTQISSVSPPYTVTGLTNGTAYYFVLESVYGSNVRSLEVSARPNELVTDGTVYTIATASDGTSYIGGSFSLVGSATGNGVPLNALTGQPISGDYPIINGNVHAITSDGLGGWYIGGDFTHVGGLARNRLAHILPDGAVDPTWNPGANGRVKAMTLLGTTLYIGGDFDNVGGEPRIHLAAINADGSMVATWSPNTNGSVHAMANDGTTLYIGGDFTDIDGIIGIDFVAAIGTDGTVSTTWTPAASHPVNSIIVKDSTVYIAGAFITIDGSTRNRLAAIGTDGMLSETWVPDANNTVKAMTALGNSIYVGGHFTAINGEPRGKLAAIGTDGVLSSSWTPIANTTVNSLTAGNNYVYVGGDFTSITIGGTTTDRKYLAAIKTNNTLVDWNPGVNQSVLSLAFQGNTVYTGGQFTSIGGVTRNNLAAFNPDGSLADWSPNINGFVRSIALAGDFVYVGGFFFQVNGEFRSNLAAIGTNGILSPSWTPSASNIVNTIAIDGTTVYVGGSFTNIDLSPRGRLAAIDINGNLSGTWTPNINNGTVNSLIVSGTTVYVGGTFTSPQNYLVAIGTDGTLASWDPGIGSTVEALTASSSQLYVGGWFTNGLVAYNLSNHSLDTGWTPSTNSGSIVYSLVNDGIDVYAGGTFTSINGNSRGHLAAIGTDGTLRSWNPNADSTVYSLSIDGSHLHVGGDFNAVGNHSRGGLATVGKDGTVQ